MKKEAGYDDDFFKKSDYWDLFFTMKTARQFVSRMNSMMSRQSYVMFQRNGHFQSSRLQFQGSEQLSHSDTANQDKNLLPDCDESGSTLVFLYV
jgi:hypothetical protein